jgi:hypothetical protein
MPVKIWPEVLMHPIQKNASPRWCGPLHREVRFGQATEMYSIWNLWNSVSRAIPSDCQTSADVTPIAMPRYREPSISSPVFDIPYGRVIPLTCLGGG